MKPLRWIEVNLCSVAHNVRTVRRLIGPGVGFTAVVKSDAYGHGVIPIARTALQNGADALAVTYLEEALPLRRAGVRAPLLAMGPVSPENAAVIRKWNLAAMVDNVPLINALKKVGSVSRPVRVQLKVNLGLYRWGIPLNKVSAFVQAISGHRTLRLDGVFAHPGYMVGKNKSRLEETLFTFKRTLETLFERRKISPRPELHVADSAVLAEFPEYHLSRVRVGNLIYGINPTPVPMDLQNPWKALSRVQRITRLAVGEMVGYGGEFVATRPMVIGTIPVGYAHGLTLEPASRWIQLQSGKDYWGIVGGVRCPFVGRVGMSHAMVDLTAVKNPQAGDVIQLPLRRTASFNWEKVYK